MLHWLETVALTADFGFAKAAPRHQHLLRAMDVLDEHGDAINKRLAPLMRSLLDQELSVVFHDLTTIEVTGEARVDDDVRTHGMSKFGLMARQFMLSLVQTAEGLPIAHEGPRAYQTFASTAIRSSSIKPFSAGRRSRNCPSPSG